MEMTPTRRLKCKSKNIYATPVNTFQHKSQKIYKGLKVRGLNGYFFMDYNSGELLEQCINAMLSYNGYITLPLRNN